MPGMLVKPGCSYYVCIVIRKTREKNRNFTKTTVLPLLPGFIRTACTVEQITSRRQPPIAPESLI